MKNNRDLLKTLISQGFSHRCILKFHKAQEKMLDIMSSPIIG